MMNKFELSIKQLSFTQKLDLIETLWADMIGNENKLDSPAWHETVLNDREADPFGPAMIEETGAV